MSVFDRLLFRQDPNSVVRKGEFLNMLDPNSVVREGEKSALMNLFADQLLDPNSVVREGEFLNMLDPNSVVREGEMMADPNSVVREGEMPTEQPIDSYTKALFDDEFRQFLITEIPNGENILEMLLQGNTPENFSALVPLLNQFTNYKATRETQNQIIPDTTFELDPAEQNFLDRLKKRAEGSPMEGEESDAVGIADGLDRETPPADPTSDGIAKVSPDQYVQLMNDIRGDDVPMEGRVQELAGVVGESDAQDTPLSVLALVQPVFELQEQQGIGATQQAQDMMPTASAQLNQPMSDGIVRANTGIFADLATVTGRSPVEMEALANIYGVNQTPVDIGQRSKDLTDIFLQQADLQNKAKLAAAPSLLKIGSTLLDPEAETSDIFTDIATEVARVGTNIGAMKDPYVKAGLTKAFAEEADRKKLFNDFRKTVGDEAVKKIFTEEEFINDGYTGFTVGKISGLPRPDQLSAYYTKKQQLDFENSQKVAAMNSIEALIPLAQGDPEQIAMIRNNPEEWLKNNRDKTSGLSEKDRNSQENTLRTEFAKNNKNFIVQADSFTKINKAAEAPSPAGDLSLIFNFMKMLDPQSTVRESEFQNAANAAPLLTRLGIDFDKVSSVWEGKVLTDNQRKDFLTKTQALYEAGKEGYDRLVTGYTDLAELYNVRPEAVIGIDFSLPDATIDIEAAVLDGGSTDAYDDSAFNPNPRAPKKK